MRFCVQPGCPVRVVSGRCPRHQRARPNEDARRWYQGTWWRTVRPHVLALVPVCPGWGLGGSACGARTTDVDHTVPHRGDRAVFFNIANLSALCHQCHARKTGSGS